MCEQGKGGVIQDLDVRSHGLAGVLGSKVRGYIDRILKLMFLSRYPGLCSPTPCIPGLVATVPASGGTKFMMPADEPPQVFPFGTGSGGSGGSSCSGTVITIFRYMALGTGYTSSHHITAFWNKV
jgi:hypothetical protein